MSRRYWIAFALCALAAAALLLVTRRLPMADLPEHAAQVAILQHFSDDCYRFDRTFELNFATPYLLGYFIARGFSVVMDVNGAMKATVWLAIVLLPLSLRALVRRTAADPWLSLLGFPLAFGFCFYWGFLNFLLALPIAIFHIALAREVSLSPSRRSIAALFGLSLLLLVAHGLLLVVCAIIAAALAAASGSWRRFAAVAVPVGAALIPAGWWVWAVRQHEAEVHHAANWQLGWYRLLHFPSTLFSVGWDRSATLFFAAVVLAIAVTMPRIARDPRRWIPLLVAAALYLFGPVSMFGSAFLFSRMATIVFAGALLVLDEPRGRQSLGRALVLLLVIGWMVVLTARFHRFSAEARGFDQLVDGMPANRRVLMFQIDPFSRVVPGPVFFHFGAYYQQRKGGLVAWSFASFYPQLVRYRPGAEPRLRSRSVSGPRSIDWEGVAQYDYLIVRSPADVGPSLFALAPYPIRPLAQREGWWLYTMPRASLPGRDCPPLE